MRMEQRDLIKLAHPWAINSMIGGFPPRLYGMGLLKRAYNLHLSNKDNVCACIDKLSPYQHRVYI